MTDLKYIIMKRRTALKNTAFMMGGILSASAVAAIFDSCVAPAAGEVWTPEFFSVEEGKMLTKIADLLIPSTDTPGALDALVPQYVDRVAKKMMGEDEKTFIKEGFKAMAAACKEATGKDFLSCTEAEQIAFLQAEEKAAIESKEPTLFGGMKDAIYNGFFKSEIGCTEVLKYDPVPGNYDGCIPYSEVNGTWAGHLG